MKLVFKTKHGENTRCLERDEELEKEGGEETVKMVILSLPKNWNQSMVVVVRGEFSW